MPSTLKSSESGHQQPISGLFQQYPDNAEVGIFHSSDRIAHFATIAIYATDGEETLGALDCARGCVDEAAFKGPHQSSLCDKF